MDQYARFVRTEVATSGHASAVVFAIGTTLPTSFIDSIQMKCSPLGGVYFFIEHIANQLGNTGAPSGLFLACAGCTGIACLHSIF